MGVGQDFGAEGNHGLAADIFGHEQSSAGKALPNILKNFLVQLQRPSEKLSGRVSGQVVTGWSQPTGNNNDLRAPEGVIEGRAHCGSIRNANLTGDLDA